jgi:hypothetical protein
MATMAAVLPILFFVAAGAAFGPDGKQTAKKDEWQFKALTDKVLIAQTNQPPPDPTEGKH